jgi:flagellar basal-body rod modification protein FlgD
MSTIPDQVLERINTAPVAEKKRTGELGQEEFLELMIAQVQHQDPFQPMENGEFISQMAQFATVDGIKEMRTSIAALNDSMTSNQALTTSSLVGRSVLADSDQLSFDGSQPAAVTLLTEPGATALTFNVYDATGALVSHRQLTPADTGVTRFAWDGRGIDGSILPAGTYRFDAQAAVDGEFVAANTAVARKIDSVTIGASLSELKLNLDNGASMSFSEAREFL